MVFGYFGWFSFIGGWAMLSAALVVGVTITAFLAGAGFLLGRTLRWSFLTHWSIVLWTWGARVWAALILVYVTGCLTFFLVALTRPAML